MFKLLNLNFKLLVISELFRKKNLFLYLFNI